MTSDLLVGTGDRMRFNLLELIVVLVASLTPVLILANEIDGDEFTKLGTGTVFAAATVAVVQVYRTWRNK